VQSDLLQPFVDSAVRVLAQMLPGTVAHEEPSEESDLSVAAEGVAALVPVHGDAAGVAMYCMSRGTALAVAGALIGKPLAGLDRVAASCITEVANIITGNAMAALEARGCGCDILPPSLLAGHGLQVTLTTPTPTFVVQTGHGPITVNVALTSQNGNGRGAR